MAKPLESRATCGTSLLDLLVALAVAAIALTQAAPAFRHTIASAERTAALNGFVSAIQHARSAANTRAQETVLCKSPGAAQCRHGATVPWSAGALVFVNLDGDSPPRVDAGEPVLLAAAPPPGVTITGNREAFVFRPFGRRATNGTLVVCDRRGAPHARALIVSPTGRPRISAARPDGSALRCDPS